MSGKVTRAAFQQLIAENVAWLEAQPRTLEREHIIEIVRESERYYYEDAQDEAIKAARMRALRPPGPHECKELQRAGRQFALISGGSIVPLPRQSAVGKAHEKEKLALEAAVNAILERRQGHS